MKFGIPSSTNRCQHIFNNLELCATIDQSKRVHLTAHFITGEGTSSTPVRSWIFLLRITPLPEASYLAMYDLLSCDTHVDIDTIIYMYSYCNLGKSYSDECHLTGTLICIIQNINLLTKTIPEISDISGRPCSAIHPPSSSGTHTPFQGIFHKERVVWMAAPAALR